jgi:fused signal recognition particle receptor
VAFDVLDAAVARSAGVAIVDTAGRMHTRQPLMQELQKVARAMGKRLAGAPHEVWMVLDAALGQNAVAQARQFHQAVPLTGIVVSKLDGSAKAGFVFSLVRELGVPILYAGLGEGVDDLVPFDPESFVAALLNVDRVEEGSAV